MRWIENFRSHRTQQAAVEGQSSTVGQVTSGVPQGSALRPTLFICINDMCKNIKSRMVQQDGQAMLGSAELQ
ncbi:hypothetical protein ACOMHN_001865 [Nucella lapillus]